MTWRRRCSVQNEMRESFSQEGGTRRERSAVEMAASPRESTFREPMDYCTLRVVLIEKFAVSGERTWIC